jgi:hypothetical protein
MYRLQGLVKDIYILVLISTKYTCVPLNMLRPRMSSIVESGLTALLSFDLDGELQVLVSVYI